MLIDKKELKIIDAHQHFWLLSRGDYDWLDAGDAHLYRDFFPRDLIPTLNKCKVLGTVLVQAAPTINETLYLLDIARKEPLVKAVVGWIDISSQSLLRDIDILSNNPFLKGIRLMLQDVKDKEFISAIPSNVVIKELVRKNMTIDCLINKLQIKKILPFLKKWDSLSIMIDHFGKPDLDIEDFDSWSSDIKEISRLPNVYIKMSGLFTQSQFPYCRHKIRDYVLRLIEYFGTKRVVWGSDWPVLTSHGSYESWLDLCKNIIFSKCNDQERHCIFYENAANFYKI